MDSYLSLASQYFINGKVSEGISELEKANKELKNSSMTIMNAGDELVSISKNNSTLMAQGTKRDFRTFWKNSERIRNECRQFYDSTKL